MALDVFRSCRVFTLPSTQAELICCRHAIQLSFTENVDETRTKRVSKYIDRCPETVPEKKIHVKIRQDLH